MVEFLGQSRYTLGDSSLADRTLTPLLPFIRREVLAKHWWAFAGKRISIDVDATVPAFEFESRYGLPGDCINIRDLYGWRGVWQVEGPWLLTDAPSPLYLRYTFDNTNYSVWDDLALELLCARIGYGGCMLLTGSMDLRDRLDKFIKEKAAEATFRSRSQQTPVELDGDIWLSARGQGRGTFPNGFP
jgi:hypothetical protein